MSRSGFAIVPFLIGLTPGLGLLAWGLVVLALRPRSGSLDGWAARYLLTLTDANRPVVARYLRRSRGLRILGAGLGWLLSPLLIALTGQGIPLFGASLLAATLGYMIAAVIAEATLARPFSTATEVRVASLTARALPDYVSTLSLWSLRILAAITIALALIFVAAPKHSYTPADPSLALVMCAALLLAVFAFAVERVLLLIVDRPQPAIGADLMAADDAIRASSIQSLMGAGVGMLLVGIGAELFWLQLTTPAESLRQVLGWLATIAVLLGLLSSMGLGQPRTWRLHRITRLTDAR
jgi:hypothetical protein